MLHLSWNRSDKIKVQSLISTTFDYVVLIFHVNTKLGGYFFFEIEWLIKINMKVSMQKTLFLNKMYECVNPQVQHSLTAILSSTLIYYKD